MEDYPTVSPERERTQVLLAAIVARLKSVVKERVACPPVLLQNRDHNRAAIIDSLLAQDAKMIRAILMWQALLSTSVIQDLCFQLVCGRILSYMKPAPLSEALMVFHESIVKALPFGWFEATDSMASAEAVKLAVEPYIEHLRYLEDLPAAAQWKQRIGRLVRALQGIESV